MRLRLQVGGVRVPNWPEAYQSALRTRRAFAETAAPSKARYATQRLPIEAAEKPRRLMLASASAAVTFAPMSGLSGASTRTDPMLVAFLSLSFLAAASCFAPLGG